MALALLAAGCGSATDDGPTILELGGSWAYEGVVQATAVQTEGTVAITESGGRQWSGTADLLETAPGSAPQRLTGAVAGRTIDSTAVTFELRLGTGTRSHLGSVRADTIEGQWFDGEASGMPSGPFRMVRTQ